jgi:bifunctional UDP-N-acetylglucosamine pyrophosphorylase/glucosamine-1-phosphate N-acetyltransferase
MRSDRPKVLHWAAGRPIVAWVLDAVAAAGCERKVVIVGHGAGEVEAALGGSDLEFVLQAEQRGTGHALAQVREVVGERSTMLLVVSGDTPLVRATTLERLLTAARRGWGAVAVAEPEAAGRLGRVVRDERGLFERCVEAVDASPDELALRTVNAGAYALPAPEIFAYLDRIRPHNAQGELYLPDALNLAAAEGREVHCVQVEDLSEAQGVNTPEELLAAEALLLAARSAEVESS